MVLKAGRFMHRATFERQVTSRNPVGELTNSWSEFASRMVSIEPLNGREYFSASGENSEITTRFRARYDAEMGAVRPFDRITHNAAVYDILSVINPDERGRELIFMTKRAG